MRSSATRCSNEIPTSDFRLFYDVGQGAVGASVLSYPAGDHEEGQRGRLFPAAGQSGNQSGRRRAAEEDGRVRASIARAA